jgi:hypothetical protein
MSRPCVLFLLSLSSILLAGTGCPGGQLPPPPQKPVESSGAQTAETTYCAPGREPCSDAVQANVTTSGGGRCKLLLRDLLVSCISSECTERFSAAIIVGGKNVIFARTVAGGRGMKVPFAEMMRDGGAHDGAELRIMVGALDDKASITSAASVAAGKAPPPPPMFAIDGVPLKAGGTGDGDDPPTCPQH